LACVCIRLLPRALLLPYTTLFRSDLRDALQNIVANGLREAGFDAGNSHQSLFHLIDELLFGQSPKPARGRVEIYQELRHVNHLGDRKSTRLNSSHEWISYAVFCLK